MLASGGVSGVRLVRSFMRWQDHIIATPDTLHGWPRFRNTRIPVSVVLDNLAAGVSAEELHADCPTLPEEAVSAALAYAADLARDSIVPISAGLVVPAPAVGS